MKSCGGHLARVHLSVYYSSVNTCQNRVKLCTLKIQDDVQLAIAKFCGEHSAAHLTSRSCSIQLCNYYTIVYTMLLLRSLKDNSEVTKSHPKDDDDIEFSMG